MCTQLALDLMFTDQNTGPAMSRLLVVGYARGRIAPDAGGAKRERHDARQLHLGRLVTVVLQPVRHRQLRQNIVLGRQWKSAVSVHSMVTLLSHTHEPGKETWADCFAEVLHR